MSNYILTKSEENRYEETLIIDRKEAEVLEQVLKEDGSLGEDETITNTAIFPNGYEVDIKCCGTKDSDSRPWTEAVLFKDGCEVAVSDVEEEYFMEWELEHNDIMFVVNVIHS